MGSHKLDLQIAKRYAQALYLYAQDKKEDVQQELNDANALIHDSAELSAFVKSPLISRQRKEAAIAKILEKNKTSKSVIQFFQLLARKKRLDLIGLITTLFNAKIAEANNQVSAELISAEKLADSKVTSISDMLSKKLHKELLLHTTVDPSIKGGIIIKIGSQMLDGSIQSQLERIRTTSKKVITSL